MVADLTRYSACKIHPDASDRPVRTRNAGKEAVNPEQLNRSRRTDPTGDEPVRLFAWVSA
jgi:hypothetical protein